MTGNPKPHGKQSVMDFPDGVPVLQTGLGPAGPKSPCGGRERAVERLGDTKSDLSFYRLTR